MLSQIVIVTIWKNFITFIYKNKNKNPANITVIKFITDIIPILSHTATTQLVLCLSPPCSHNVDEVRESEKVGHLV